MAGRHKIPIDLAKVRWLAGRGLNEAEICMSLGISQDTLGRRKKDSADFAGAIKTGRAETHALVANKLFELTQAGHLGAIVWYEKTRCGMFDRVAVEVDWREKVREAGYDPDELFRSLVASGRVATNEVAGRSRSGALPTGVSAERGGVEIADDDDSGSPD